MSEWKSPNAIVLERRKADGKWWLDVRHRDTLYEEMAGTAGEANRWITLRAMRVQKWLVNARAAEPDLLHDQ